MSRSAVPADSASERRRALAASLVVEDLRQVYGLRNAVDGVSWQADAGEVICLLGHSGCGKTTLLRLIAGIEAPSSGRVLFDGQEISGPRVFVPPEQRRVGLVFQDYALFPHLTVLDNVMFGLRDGTAALRRAHALQALERVGLASHAGTYPHTLSGGEQQRVALARALAPQPRVLLMDEPFSNLDKRLRDRVRDETMTLLREAGTTVVVVTHDPEEALRIADRIVLMQSGRVEQIGTPEDLYQRPRSLFAARYFSDLNEIEGMVARGAVDTALGRFPAPALAEGSRARVCLRPQDLQLGAAGSGPAARVSERVFLGDAVQLRVAVDGLSLPLSLRCREPSAPQTGQTVHLDLQHAAALVFAA